MCGLQVIFLSLVIFTFDILASRWNDIIDVLPLLEELSANFGYLQKAHEPSGETRVMKRVMLLIPVFEILGWWQINFAGVRGRSRTKKHIMDQFMKGKRQATINVVNYKMRRRMMKLSNKYINTSRSATYLRSNAESHLT